MPLILNIGFHKTGSTALQTWLHENSEALRAHNLLFPPGLSSWLGHPEIAWAFSGNRYPWADCSYDLAQVQAHYAPYLEIARRDDAIVILSSEEFCRLDFEIDVIHALKVWLAPTLPIVMGFFREPLDFLLSRYRHEVQHGGELRPLRQFLSNIDNLLSANFHSRTQIWEQCFDNRCIFRDYSETLQKDGGVVQSFLEALDIDWSSFDVLGVTSGAYRESEKKIHPSLIDCVRQLHVDPPSRGDMGRALDLILAISDLLPCLPLRSHFDSIGLGQDLLEMLNSLRIDTINKDRSLKMLVTERNGEPTMTA